MHVIKQQPCPVLVFIQIIVYVLMCDTLCLLYMPSMVWIILHFMVDILPECDKLIKLRNFFRNFQQTHTTYTHPLVWPQWWSFAYVSQKGVDFSKKISKKKKKFDLTFTDVHMDRQKLCTILENKVVLLKYPSPALIWEGGQVCFSSFYRRFLAQNLKFYENQNSKTGRKLFFFNSIFNKNFILTLQPDLT